MVYGLALSILPDAPLATRLTREVYADLWRQAPRYDRGRGTVLAWLLSTAHRRLVDEVRTLSKDRAAGRHAVLNGDRGFDRVRPDGRCRRAAERTRMAWCSLPPISREAVGLTYFGGYHQAEAARVLGLPLGTAETSIRDGLVALRAAIEEGS